MQPGRKALITGSTSGIGLGIARALARRGCDVMLNGLGDRDAIDALRVDLQKEHGVRIFFHGADLTKPPEIIELMDASRQQLGGLDILINNAGIQHTAPVEQLPPLKWDAILAVNVSASFHTIRLALPGMRAAKWGRIVNIASVHGLVASINKAAYVAAKHALVGLTKVVALETAGSGITCNAVCPGFTRTPLAEPQIAARAAQLGVDLEQGAKSLLAEKQPSGQFVTVDQIGELVLFLCSDAAAQMTGAAIPIDGGWTVQ